MSVPRAPAERTVCVVTDVSDRPWSDVSPADYASAAEYCAACLIDENELGYTHSKSRCKLPVYEPQRLGGLLNRNAVHAAAGRLLNRHDLRELPPAARQSVAQMLVDLYAEIGDAPPDALTHLAGGRTADRPGHKRPAEREGLS